jgi:hypothetical protein
MEENKSKTPEDKYLEMIVEGLRARKTYEEYWTKVEKLLDGSYEPFMYDGETDTDLRMKTYLMSVRIETELAVLMPPPDLEFICEPSNKTETPDLESSITAKAILDYFMNHHDDYEQFELAIRDFIAFNRAILYLGFHVDDRDDTVSEWATRAGEWEQHKAVNSDNQGRMKGQPYLQRVMAKNMLRAPGFKTISNAYSKGGWIAERRIDHIDWVHKNEYYKRKRTEIKGYMENPYYKADEPPELQDSQENQSDNANKYNWTVNWHIYEAPSKKHTDGWYTVFNPFDKIILCESALDKIGFPYMELIDTLPMRGDYMIPKPILAERAFLAYEYFETKALEGVASAKILVPYTDNAGDSDNFKTALIDRDQMLVPVKVNDSINIRENLDVIPIPVDVTAAVEGSIRSKAMLDEIMGPNFADPRMGDKVATEMMLQNKIYMSKTNRKLAKINRWIAQVMEKKLDHTKNLTTHQEQSRMTREMSRNWEDHNKVTLDGNYVISVKSSALLDMTEGERAKLTQMWLQLIVSLKAIPGNEKKYDESPIVKQMAEDLGYSTVGVISDYPESNQWYELTMMLTTGKTWPVEPEDNDVEHLMVIREWAAYLQQMGVEPKEEEIAVVFPHIQAHQQQVEFQQKGAAGGPIGMNQENTQRQAMGETIGSRGALTPGGA